MHHSDMYLVFDMLDGEPIGFFVTNADNIDTINLRFRPLYDEFAIYIISEEEYVKTGLMGSCYKSETYYRLDYLSQGVASEVNNLRSYKTKQND